MLRQAQNITMGRYLRRSMRKSLRWVSCNFFPPNFWFPLKLGAENFNQVKKDYKMSTKLDGADLHWNVTSHKRIFQWSGQGKGEVDRSKYLWNQIQLVLLIILTRWWKHLQNTLWSAETKSSYCKIILLLSALLPNKRKSVSNLLPILDFCKPLNLAFLAFAKVSGSVGHQ